MATRKGEHHNYPTRQQGLHMEDLPLTETQDKMMALAAQGYTYEEIGKSLCYSVDTIKRYFAHYIYPKLRAVNRTQAVANWVWLHVLSGLLGAREEG